ncbi:MAG TPA: hypothetical protein VEA61_03625 [Allosphingosinicella sp.]|nr:hypothetical protein [Allosphingosinicella sp.]
MNANSLKRASIVAAAFAFAPAAALAQNATDPAYDATTNTQYAAPVQEEDDDFPWGCSACSAWSACSG